MFILTDLAICLTISWGRSSLIFKQNTSFFFFQNRQGYPSIVTTAYRNSHLLQVDLLLRPANLTGPVPTWHGAPSQVNHCVPNGST